MSWNRSFCGFSEGGISDRILNPRNEHLGWGGVHISHSDFRYRYNSGFLKQKFWSGTPSDLMSVDQKLPDFPKLQKNQNSSKIVNLRKKIAKLGKFTIAHQNSKKHRKTPLVHIWKVLKPRRCWEHRFGTQYHSSRTCFDFGGTTGYYSIF